MNWLQTLYDRYNELYGTPKKRRRGRPRKQQSNDSSEVKR
jgi:hypothetical protein